MIRGGRWLDWIDYARGCRVANRDGYYPGSRGDFLGFQVLLAPSQP